MDRSADNHYPTSPTEIIAGRPVASVAADDCVLFLWATVPMLPQALRVMAAWGFEYKTNFIWTKDRIGTVYWNRNKHEHLLVGVRGKPPAPAPGTQWESVLHAPVGGHSAKPQLFLELIEGYFPMLPKIELNRRGRAPAPAPGTQWESVLHAPVGGHSAKPQLFLELIEGYFPTLPKIELNRRGRARPGWDAWGNEAT